MFLTQILNTKTVYHIEKFNSRHLQILSVKTLKNKTSAQKCPYLYIQVIFSCQIVFFEKWY